MHDTATRDTVALVCSVWSTLLSSRDELISILQPSRDGVGDPLLFLLLFIEHSHIRLVGLRHNIIRDMIELRKQVALEAFESGGSSVAQPDPPDLVRITGDLTKLQSRALNLKAEFEVLHRSKAEFTTFHRWYLNELESQDRDKVLPLWEEIQQRIEYVHSHSLRLSENMTSVHHEAQASVQTVRQLSLSPIKENLLVTIISRHFQVYSMIGTNDSRLNYEAAMASVRIADDSRKVAILARQDSTDMRVIAGTTLLFLPATFVAVSAPA